jgi:ribosomal protein L21E
MNIDSQVAFYHEVRRSIFTGVIIGKEGTQYQISYQDGKGKKVTLVTPKQIIPLDK